MGLGRRSEKGKNRIRKFLKMSPCLGICLKSRQNIRIDYKSTFRHIRQKSSSCICHSSHFLHSSAAFFVQLRPLTVFPPRNQFLNGYAVFHFFYDTVNPAETHCFLDGINIP